MMTCTVCRCSYEELNENEKKHEQGQICPRCIIVSSLLDVQSKMNHAARLMIGYGGDYESRGRQMLGAARTIEGWFNEMG